MANIRVVGWVMGNNKEELGENAPQLNSAFYFSNQMMSWGVPAGTPTEGRTEGHSLGVLLQDPFHEVLRIFAQVNNIRNGP